MASTPKAGTSSSGRSGVGILGFLLGFLIAIAMAASGIIRPLKMYTSGTEFDLTALVNGQSESEADDSTSLTAAEIAALRTMLSVPRRNDEADSVRALTHNQYLVDQEVVYQRNLMRRSKAYPEPPKDVLNTLYYYTPHYVCKHERVGNWHDGGKWMCDPRAFDSSTIVYSVGSNGDVSFETDLRAICNGCQIHTFDMTLSDAKLKAVHAAESLGVLKFHDFGLSVIDDPLKKLKSLKSMMSSLGHTHIDFLKIDCEGCEWSFFSDLFKDWTPGLIKQMSIELHYYNKLQRTHTLLKQMEKLGYRIFQFELNYQFPLSHIEISLVHESFALPSTS